MREYQGLLVFPSPNFSLPSRPMSAVTRGGWCDLFLSFSSNNKWDVLSFVSAGGRDAAARDEVNV